MHAPAEAYHEKGLDGIATFLPWLLPLPNDVMLLSGGGFMSAYEYTGISADTATEGELRSVLGTIADLVGRMGKGWIFHFQLCRFPSPRYHADNPNAPAIVRLLDAERRQLAVDAGLLYESRLYFTIEYENLENLDTKAREFFFADASDIQAQRAAESVTEADHALYAERDQQTFLAGREQIETALQGALRVRRLGLVERASAIPGIHPAVTTDDEALSFLYFCLTGRWQRISQPPPLTTIAHLFAQHELSFSGSSYMDGVPFAVVRTVAPPPLADPSHANHVFLKPYPMRVSLRVVCLDRAEGLREAERRRDEHKQNIFSLMDIFTGKSGPKGDGTGSVNTVAVQRVQDAERALHRLRGNEGQGDAISLVQPHFCIVIYGGDQSEIYAGKLVEELRNSGIVSEVARVDAPREFAASLPGERWAQLSKRYWTNAFAARMVQVTSIWAGVTSHPSPFYKPEWPCHIIATGYGNTPVRLPLHWNQAGHTLVIGAQRGGKSVLLKRLLWQHLALPGARGFVLDRDYSMFTLACALRDEGRADYLSLDDETTSFNPLAFIGESSDERELALSFVEHLCFLRGVPRTKTLRTAIAEGIDRLAERTRCSLADLRRFVANKDLWGVLDYYTDPKTRIGQLLGGTSMASMDRDVLVVEMSGLNALSVEDRTPIYRFLLHLALRKADGSPMIAIADELSALLSDEPMARFLFEVLRRWGKKNVAGVFATQGAVDITSAKELGAALAQECKTKIFTGDSSARDATSAANLRAIATLSDTELETIARNEQHRWYYYTSPLGRVSFSLGLQGVERAFLTCDENDDRKALERLQVLQAASWPVEHLRARGGGSWADLYSAFRAQTAFPLHVVDTAAS